VAYPAARVLKGQVLARKKQRRRPRAPLSPSALRELMEGAGFVIERVERVGCEVMLDPFDHWTPKIAFRAARQAERSRMLRRALGTDLLFVVRSP